MASNELTLCSLPLMPQIVPHCWARFSMRSCLGNCWKGLWKACSSRFRHLKSPRWPLRDAFAILCTSQSLRQSSYFDEVLFAPWYVEVGLEGVQVQVGSKPWKKATGSSAWGCQLHHASADLCAS